MSTIRAPRTSSPGPTMRPSTIASLRSGEYRIVPSTASNGSATSGGWVGLTRVAAGSRAGAGIRTTGAATGGRFITAGGAVGTGGLFIASCGAVTTGGLFTATGGAVAIGGLFTATGGAVALGGLFTAGGAVTTGGLFTSGRITPAGGLFTTVGGATAGFLVGGVSHPREGGGTFAAVRV